MSRWTMEMVIKLSEFFNYVNFSTFDHGRNTNVIWPHMGQIMLTKKPNKNVKIHLPM